MDSPQAVKYLESLIGRQLRIQITDSRMFVGLFKCTDSERNIILANSFEYRLPAQSAVQAAAKDESLKKTMDTNTTVKVNMSSRLIGLIVIPGQYITKIELE